MMNSDYLNTDGRKYLERLPQYITQYPKFMELMGYILEYIDNSIEEVNKINPKSSVLAQLNINYLQALANKFNLTIGNNEYTAIENYKDLLYGAISGVWCTMHSVGDKQSLQSILNILYPGASVIISEEMMQYRAAISTIDVVPDVSSILSLWLKTDITGVTEIFEFNDKNSFKWSDIFTIYTDYSTFTNASQYIDYYVDGYTLYNNYILFNMAENYIGYYIDYNGNKILITGGNYYLYNINPGNTAAYISQKILVTATNYSTLNLVVNNGVDNTVAYTIEETEQGKIDEYVPDYIEDGQVITIDGSSKDKSYYWLSLYNNTTKEKLLNESYTINGVIKYKYNAGLYKQEYV